MAMIKMGNTAYDIPDAVAPGVQQHLDNLNDKLTGLETSVADSTTKLDEAQAKLDAGVEKVTALETKLVDAKDAMPDVEAVLAFRKSVSLVDAKFDCVGKSGADVKRELVLANVGDGVDLKGKSDDYITARFDLLVEAKVADGKDNNDMSKGFKEAGITQADLADAKSGTEAARKKRLERSQNAWKQDDK